MKQRGIASIIILLGLAVLILLGGVVIYQKVLAPKVNLTSIPTSSPTSDPTVNWKTYTDTKYSYSLRYPSEWQINPPPIGDGILIGRSEPNEDQISIDVSSSRNENDSLGNCKETTLEKIKATRCESTSKISAERGVVYITPITSKTVSVIGYYKGNYYKLSLTFNENSEKFDLFDQILSTFKFLD